VTCWELRHPATAGCLVRQFAFGPGRSLRRGSRTTRTNRIEQVPLACRLLIVSKLTKFLALTILAVWGLASMHCKLEAVPGFDFLKICCFADSAPSSPKDCDRDGCGAVEDGSYRSEEQTASAPPPLLVLAVLASVIEPAAPDLHAHSLVASRLPPEMPKAWQFSQRTALPPRAP
jgi:hypothetical protein